MWWVDAARAPVDWGAAVSGGAATAPITLLVDDGAGRGVSETLWAVTGQAVSAGQVSAAQAAASGDAVPPRRASESGLGAAPAPTPVVVAGSNLSTPRPDVPASVPVLWVATGAPTAMGPNDALTVVAALP